MQLRRLKFDKALQQVRQKRSVASPNEGFRGQLRAWNRETWHSFSWFVWRAKETNGKEGFYCTDLTVSPWWLLGLNTSWTQPETWYQSTGFWPFQIVHDWQWIPSHPYWFSFRSFVSQERETPEALGMAHNHKVIGTKTRTTSSQAESSRSDHGYLVGKISLFMTFILWYSTCSMTLSFTAIWGDSNSSTLLDGNPLVTVVLNNFPITRFVLDSANLCKHESSDLDELHQAFQNCGAKEHLIVCKPLGIDSGLSIGYSDPTPWSLINDRGPNQASSGPRKEASCKGWPISMHTAFVRAVGLKWHRNKPYVGSM